MLPVFVDGDGAERVYVEGFVGAAYEQFDFLCAEEAEGVARAHSEEAALERLELARDSTIKEIADVEVDEFGAIGVGDGCVCAVGNQRVLNDRAVTLNGNDKRPAVGRLDITRKIE